MQQRSPSPPSTWTLFRLWRFAKPYKVAAACRFPADTRQYSGRDWSHPYLTMPLMDNVLIPYQNGKPIDVDLVTFYLDRPAWRGASGLGVGLGADLYAGAGFRAHRRRPAHRYL